MKKIIKAFAIIPCCIVLLGALRADAPRSTASTQIYLFVGFDEAAENTDSLILLSYDPAEALCCAMQIPRDTYCSFEGSYGRINRIYSSARCNGEDEKTSMAMLSSAVEKYLGIKLDGYFGISVRGFKKCVNSLGGVYVTIPPDFKSNPLDGKSGELLLSGEDALRLVRHRASYPTGDIGRLNAQKLFIDGAFNTVFKRASVKQLSRFVNSVAAEAITSFSLAKLLSLTISLRKDLSVATPTLLTLPGKAVCLENKWYYVVNREASSHATEVYLHRKTVAFDEEHLLTNFGIAEINDVYCEKSFLYNVYHGGIYEEQAVG